MTVFSLPWLGDHAHPKAARTADARTGAGAWAGPRPRKIDAANAEDLVLDVVVVLSTLMFVLLAIGVGALALQAAIH